MGTKPTFKIKVINAEKTLIETEAISMTALNRRGKFDILPNHCPFLCVLSAGDVIIRKPDKTKEQVTIAKGILKFINNEAVVLTGL
jgi:F0F1-type ATP synthase epsilon subunit